MCVACIHGGKAHNGVCSVVFLCTYYSVISQWLLELAMLGVFTPWEVANTKIQDFFISPKSQFVNHLPAHHLYKESFIWF